MKRLSIDEVSQRKGDHNFVTVGSDIDRRLLLEVIDSHKQENIIEVLKQQPFEVRSSVKARQCGYVGRLPQGSAVSFPKCADCV